MNLDEAIAKLPEDEREAFRLLRQYDTHVRDVLDGELRDLRGRVEQLEHQRTKGSKDAAEKH